MMEATTQNPCTTCNISQREDSSGETLLQRFFVDPCYGVIASSAERYHNTKSYYQGHRKYVMGNFFLTFEHNGQFFQTTNSTTLHHHFSRLLDLLHARLQLGYNHGKVLVGECVKGDGLADAH
jgi:hypothetical protein